MAYFSRVIALLLLVFAGSAFSGSRDYYWYGNFWFPTAEAGCASVSPPTPNHVFSHVFIPPGYGDAYWQCFFADTTIPPPNTTQNGGGMKSTCPVGKIADYAAKRCVDPPPVPECTENQELDTETNTCVCKTGPAGSFAVSGDVLTGCNDGCTIVLNSGSYSSSANKTYGYWRQNGNTCSPSPELPGVDSPDSPDGQDAGKCPTGQCPGTLNGQFMCVPCKGKESSDSSSSENTTETPSGASAPSGSASQSQSGSKTTECEGGVCVTKETVVVTNPDGSTTEKEKETTESLNDFCTKNPRAAICKAADESSWGGACSDGFQCQGDAVQCAQAQASWKSACAADVSGMTEQINTGTAAMAAGAASGLDIPGASDTFDLGSRLSEVPLFGSSGGCPSDVSVNVGGTSYTIAFSAMCPQLQVLGVALMAFAYLVAGFIVFRGDRS